MNAPGHIPSPAIVWNPADYAANSASQLSWARDLIETLRLRGDERLLDVGCGDGKVTAEIARALPRGEVVGVDTSPDMLRFARAKFPPSKFSTLRFRRMDARQLRFARPFEIVFSNATLHWVDDHAAFLHGAAACLRPGGRLVVSCGGKGNAQDVFRAVRGVMRAKQFRDYFRRMSTPYFFHQPQDYERRLPRCGFASFTVRLAEKSTHLAGQAGFIAWFRTTWLPYTQRVPEHLRDGFIAAVARQYMTKNPPDAQGLLLVRNVRLEISAVKSGTDIR